MRKDEARAWEAVEKQQAVVDAPTTEKLAVDVARVGDPIRTSKAPTPALATTPPLLVVCTWRVLDGPHLSQVQGQQRAASAPLAASRAPSSTLTCKSSTTSFRRHGRERGAVQVAYERHSEEKKALLGEAVGRWPHPAAGHKESQIASMHLGRSSSTRTWFRLVT